MIFPGLKVQAATTDDLQQKSQEMLQKRQEAAAAEKKASQKETEANRLQDQVKKLDQEINVTEKKITDTGSQITQTTSDINLTSQDISQRQKELDAEQQRLREILITIYKTGNRSLIWRLLANRSLSDFLNQQQYIESLELKTESLIQKISTVKKQLEEQKKQLEDKKQNLDQLKNQQENYQKGLESNKTTKEKLKAQAIMSAAEYKKQADAAAKAAAQLQNELISLQKSIGKKGAIGLPKGALYGTKVKTGDIIGYEGSTGMSTGPHLHFAVLENSAFKDPIGYLGGKLAWPIGERTSRYSNGISQTFGCTDLAIEPYNSACSEGHFHYGLDIVAEGGSGSAVGAAADGEVIGDGWNAGGYGHYIVIDHGNNLWTLYGHLL
ncbi:MAG: peptidase [Candidatus Berkelbacteria bacterium Licking1014_2]|uniref:Peptidase n=1 Tax=Candidatus Berkelbacteria bacterium Licking1014_2 TaxID=2017146 RepID=A0A554LVY1_9BACT|nr:MAG: peptidase [Candidatus Berkelbacteria bacterium Licking1014_2]